MLAPTCPSLPHPISSRQAWVNSRIPEAVCPASSPDPKYLRKCLELLVGRGAGPRKEVGPVCRWRCLCECAACVHASVCVRVYPRGNWSLERKSRVEHRLSPFPHRSSYLRWVSTSESSFLLWLNMKTVLGRWSGKD